MPTSKKNKTRPKRKSKKNTRPHVNEGVTTLQRDLDGLHLDDPLDTLNLTSTLTPDILPFVVAQLDLQKTDDVHSLLAIQRCSSLGWSLVTPITYRALKITNWSKLLLSGDKDEPASPSPNSSDAPAYNVTQERGSNVRSRHSPS